MCLFFFFFNQKTAYELRISDWSSDVCSSDLVIPATVSEAPYILHGLLMNDAGRRVRQHFADTGGFTDHVFAACSLLGYRFAPRIRDLPQKRLYAFTPNATPANVRALVGGKINEPLIERNWPDILRSEEHTSELQSLMRISYAVFCLKKKKKNTTITDNKHT